MRPSICIATCTLLVAACSTARDDGNPWASGAGTEATSTITSATSGGTDGTSAQDDDTASDTNATSAGSGGPIFDVGGAETDGSSGCVEGNCGCTMVDVLLVIDNSTSMRSYQQSLAAAAPGFADELIANLPPGTDLHVGVTTTSFYQGGGTSPGEGNCEPYYEGAGMMSRDDLYDYYWTPDVMEFAENGAQGRLFEHQGKRYFEMNTGDDPAAMTSWLVGAITGPGEGGSVWEMVAAGGAYPFHAANDDHNAGFLRDEGAVLVLFLLTDEVGNSPEDVAVYHDLVVQAKQGCGGDKCVVSGGIMQPCLKTATDTRIFPFLASFGSEPIVGDIGPELDDCFEDCEQGEIDFCDAAGVTCTDLLQGKGTDYSEVLGATLAQSIAQTCAEIPPAG
jgi:hypothetical protein